MEIIGEEELQSPHLVNVAKALQYKLGWKRSRKNLPTGVLWDE